MERGEPRPLWFVFSGIGSQWAGMGRELIRVPLFLESIRRCAEPLKKHGIDLLHVLTQEDDSAFDNVINTFVSIAAVQVGLVDLFRAVGLRPDGFLGHSAGEMGKKLFE